MLRCVVLSPDGATLKDRGRSLAAWRWLRDAAAGIVMLISQHRTRLLNSSHALHLASVCQWHEPTCSAQSKSAEQHCSIQVWRAQDSIGGEHDTDVYEVGIMISDSSSGHALDTA